MSKFPVGTFEWTKEFLFGEIPDLVHPGIQIALAIEYYEEILSRVASLRALGDEVAIVRVVEEIVQLRQLGREDSAYHVSEQSAYVALGQVIQSTTPIFHDDGHIGTIYRDIIEGKTDLPDGISTQQIYFASEVLIDAFSAFLPPGFFDEEPSDEDLALEELFREVSESLGEPQPLLANTPLASDKILRPSSSFVEDPDVPRSLLIARGLNRYKDLHLIAQHLPADLTLAKKILVGAAEFCRIASQDLLSEFLEERRAQRPEQKGPEGDPSVPPI